MRLRALVLALGVAVGVAMPLSAEGRATPPDEAVGYWTAERVRGAQSRDVVLGVARGPEQPRPRPENPGNKPEKNPDDGTGDTGDLSGSVVTGAPWPENQPDASIDDLVGKVLFTLGTTDYVCSASTIAPSTGTAWVVMTAGHCTWDRGSYATNWVFVPDYETVREFGCSGDDNSLGTSGQGCYAATSLHAHADWIGSDGANYAADVAFARMANSRPDQGDVGALPVLRTETAIGVEVTALGYPAAKKYNGNDLIYCLGAPVPGPSSYSANPGLACDMTGGSSGGPWYSDTNGDGVLEATSLNSFGLRGYNGYMFGPVFDGGAAEALGAATDAPSQ